LSEGWRIGLLSVSLGMTQLFLWTVTVTSSVTNMWLLVRRRPPTPFRTMRAFFNCVWVAFGYAVLLSSGESPQIFFAKVIQKAKRSDNDWLWCHINTENFETRADVVNVLSENLWCHCIWIFSLSAVAATVLFSAEFCFSVTTINHGTLLLPRWNIALTCTSATSRTLLNFKSYSKVKVTWVFVLLCAWYCGYPRTVLSLEQGLMFFFCLCSTLNRSDCGEDLGVWNSAPSNVTWRISIRCTRKCWFWVGQNVGQLICWWAPRCYH